MFERLIYFTAASSRNSPGAVLCGVLFRELFIMFDMVTVAIEIMRVVAVL
jgi:hypothetical protein